MCETCGKAFRLASICRLHFKTHSEEEQFSRLFKCDAPKCTFSTMMPDKLKKHKETCVELQAPVLVEAFCDKTQPVSSFIILLFYR